MIYGFSQDGSSRFVGSLYYLASAINVSKNTVIRILNTLQEKGLIKKVEKDVNGVKFCEYYSIYKREESDGESQNLDGGSNLALPGQSAQEGGSNLVLPGQNLVDSGSNLGGGGSNLAPNNKYNNKDNKEKETTTKVVAKKQVSLTLSQRMEDRANAFGHSLVCYVDTYGKAMIRAFYDYWTEPNKSGTKMRFELERTWDTKRRLSNWSNHEKNYGNNRKNDSGGKEWIKNDVLDTAARVFSGQAADEVEKPF
jgi:DNA-binding Lrp family transcriptional regulator